ncbi:hypothetical protein SEA_GILDA_67 [Microbacterium phage Gilda]|uniref:Uncharacterized protein n=4 Tax=Krampusvirus krampus TaxID=2734242 RepID=A0A2Z4Q351_9CAUD|nr:hypothetical protein HOT40_gp67 [Microbacterium phage Krampus]AWY04522.1 hypothetical protein SEA_ANNASERENA_67 [Microbacterium phage AnnaSerena]QCQ57429.1 hypothetical protein SEA_RACHELLA_67 [Microbacterium phage Rachella]QOC58725.1 hypothetical protein SEA_GILDA_67 [Microbacterium phage Gilda]UDG78686.1 hypothetical protein SEA_NEPTUNE_67 [Microbacterium phage Neptune]UDL15545.1 hypothetical protein SEA_CYBELE_67 [Microbacterium phage Cybele]URP21733.1 hypothetical protein SEA_KATE_67 [
MADTRQCNNRNHHEPHEWSHVVKQSWHDEIGTREYHWCEGVTFFASAEGITEKIGVTRYKDLTRLTFELVTREGVPTRFDFADLTAGDSKASVTVVEGDDRWAVVDIRILARKPFIATEVDAEEDARRLF